MLNQNSFLSYIDAETVEVFNDYSSYIKDKHRIYYILQPIENFDINSFEYIGRGYLKDKNNVYYDGKKINGANPETFILYSSQYGDAKDKNGYYYYGIKRITNN